MFRGLGEPNWVLWRFARYVIGVYGPQDSGLILLRRKRIMVSLYL